jgi:hypothetical protein
VGELGRAGVSDEAGSWLYRGGGRRRGVEQLVGWPVEGVGFVRKCVVL